MTVHRHFECPHCEAQVPATLEDLHAAAVAITCPGCRRTVYLTMGRLSNYQPGDQADDYLPSYDSGA